MSKTTNELWLGCPVNIEPSMPDGELWFLTSDGNGNPLVAGTITKASITDAIREGMQRAMNEPDDDDGTLRRVAGRVESARAARYDEIDWQRKFDALVAAVFEQDDATRDRILARAKELETDADGNDQGEA